MSEDELLEGLSYALMLAQFRVDTLNDRMEAEVETQGYVFYGTAASCDFAEGFEEGLLHAIAVVKHCYSQQGIPARLTMLPLPAIAA